jgi:hypothetical protein
MPQWKVTLATTKKKETEKDQGHSTTLAATSVITLYVSCCNGFVPYNYSVINYELNRLYYICVSTGQCSRFSCEIPVSGFAEI